jgi:ubiquinone/menaquinone biosynthesis C-methylase UbiE
VPCEGKSMNQNRCADDCRQSVDCLDDDDLRRTEPSAATDKMADKEYWRAFWNAHSKSDGMYGRDTWSHREFCLLITDVVMALDLKRDDVVLDAGGGTGTMSIALSPFVKRITLFDFGDDIVEKARHETGLFKNIEVLKDDVCAFEHIRNGYTKAIVGSVLQYLSGYDDVEMVLAHLFRVLVRGGRAMFTHNPDLSKKAAHIESYKRLTWSEERVRASLDIEEKRFWVDKEKFRQISRKTGFGWSSESPINDNLWQSTHMFDWVVEK